MVKAFTMSYFMPKTFAVKLFILKTGSVHNEINHIERVLSEPDHCKYFHGEIRTCSF
jgi:hypothetical protein